MRPLLAGLAFSLLVGCASAPLPPASAAPEPMERANRVDVRLDEPPAEALRLVARALAARGYGVESSDAALGILSTSPRAVGGIAVEIDATADDADGGSVVQLRGRFALDVRGLRTPMRIDLRGAGGSAARQAWDELVATAETFGGTVAYARD